MKTTKLIIAFVLVLLLSFALYGCSGNNSASSENKTDTPADTQSVVTEAPATEAPDYTGTYNAFAYTAEEMGLDNVLISLEDKGTMTFTLADDGTGTAAINGQEASLTWKMDNNNLIITSEIGQDIMGTVKDGVMDISMTTNGITAHYYLAKPDADISSYQVISLQEAMNQMSAE